MFGSRRLDDHIKECGERYRAMREDFNVKHHENQVDLRLFKSNVYTRMDRLFWLLLTGLGGLCLYLIERILISKGIL